MSSVCRSISLCASRSRVPGLGIRITGEITKEKCDILREADAIFREEIANAGLDTQINQYFAVLTNTRTVGVMGDSRTYDYALALRGVTTSDFMTADWARIPYDVLDKASTPYRKRGRRRKPHRVRYHLQAPRYDRVGMRKK